MKSAGEILKALGFNPNAPMETQKAFFKHLAQNADPKLLKSEEKPETKAVPAAYEQLEFSFSAGTQKDRKVS